VLLVLLVLQAQLEQPDHKEYRVKPELQGLKGLRDHKVLMELKVLKGRKEWDL
jgi:hypothetical protein